ncbi:MAG: hypothetical protein JWM21_4949 [Acidobacteria bacterium]|nr:hypothetical protein [Acidobacteriota bacterium]
MRYGHLIRLTAGAVKKSIRLESALVRVADDTTQLIVKVDVLTKRPNRERGAQVLFLNEWTKRMDFFHSFFRWDFKYFALLKLGP